MVIIMLMLFVTPQKAYSGPIGDWIKGKINDSVSTMADEMLSGLGQRMSETVEAIGNDIVSGMVGGLGPDLTAFDNFVSGRDINTKGAAAYRDVHNKFTTVAQVFGYGIAIIILLISLLQFFIAKPGELKDTPFRLVFKFILSIGLIAGSREIMDMILEVANDIWTNVIMSEVINGKTLTLSYDTLAPVTVSGEEVAIDLLAAGGKALAFKKICGLIPGIGAFIGLFQLLIYWPLIKGFVKLYIEIVERYLVVVLLYFFFGAAAGTIVSNNTSNVFKSYMRMVASQIFLLFVNAALLSVFIDALLRKAFTVSVPNYIFGLAFLKVCQRIDSYMASLGLNVAQTGGQTLDAILGAGAGILRGLGNLGRSAGKGANLASAVAEKGGHFKTAAGLKALSGTRGAADVIGAGGIDSAARLMAANRGKSFSATPDQAATMIKDFMGDPNNQKKAAMIAGYDDQSLIAGMNKIMADSGQNIHVSDIDRSTLNKHGQLKFRGTAGEGANAQNISGTFAMNEIPRADNVKAGDGYVAYDNRLKQNPGEIHRGDANSLGKASGKSNIIDGASQGYKDRIAGMSYDAETGDCALYDKDQNQIGTIAKIDGKEQLIQSAAPLKKDEATGAIVPDKDGSNKMQQTLSHGIYGDGDYKDKPEDYSDNKFAAAHKEEIQGAMGFKSLEYDKVDPTTGEAHGKATIENKFGGDDKKVDVVMRDVGMHGRTGNGKVVTTSDGYAFEIQTAAPSKNKVSTEASKGEGGEGDNAPTGSNPNGSKPTGSNPNGSKPTGSNGGSNENNGRNGGSGGNNGRNGGAGNNSGSGSGPKQTIVNAGAGSTGAPKSGNKASSSTNGNNSAEEGGSGTPRTIQTAGENGSAATAGGSGSNASTSSGKTASPTSGSGTQTKGRGTATGASTGSAKADASSKQTIMDAKGNNKTGSSSGSATTSKSSSATGSATPTKSSATGKSTTGSGSGKASSTPKTIQSAGGNGKATSTSTKGTSSASSKSGSGSTRSGSATGSNSTSGNGSRAVTPQKGSATATGSSSKQTSTKNGSGSAPKTIQGTGGNGSTTSKRPVSSSNGSTRSYSTGSAGGGRSASAQSGSNGTQRTVQSGRESSSSAQATGRGSSQKTDTEDATSDFGSRAGVGSDVEGNMNFSRADMGINNDAPHGITDNDDYEDLEALQEDLSGTDDYVEEPEEENLDALQEDLDDVDDYEEEPEEENLDDLVEDTDGMEDYEEEPEEEEDLDKLVEREDDDDYDESYEEEERRDDLDAPRETEHDEGDDIDSLLQWRKLNKNISNDSADGDTLI